MVAEVVADGLEVLLDALAYGDDTQLGTEALGYGDGVVLGAVGGAEAGHGDGDDVLPRQAQLVHGVGAGEHDERGVHTAGDADDRAPAVGVLHALYEAGGLDVQAARGKLGYAFVGYEGLALYPAGELSLGELELPGIAGHRGRRHGGKGSLTHAGAGEVEDVELADGHAGAVLALGQGLSVVHDEAEAGVALVRGALAGGGGGVDGAVVQALGLIVERALGLKGGLHAHGLVGELGDDGGAGGAERCGGRHGQAPVGGKLDADHELAHGVRAEESLALEAAVVGVLEVDVDGLARVQAGEHGAADVAACGEAQDLALADGGRRAVHGTARVERQADDGEHVAVARGVGYLAEALERGVQQGLLVVQVPAGGAGDGELREHEELHALALSLFDAFDDLFSVVPGVCHAEFRRGGRGFDETVFHLVSVSLSVPAKMSRKSGPSVP